MPTNTTTTLSHTDRRRTVRTWLLIAGAVLAMPLSAGAAGPDHTLVSPGEIEWAAGPPSIPKGAKAAVLYGKPGEEGLFALRLWLPAGYHLPPHTHPKPEVVTVISGEFRIGMGRESDRNNVRALAPGSFFAFPPGMVHYAYTDVETVIQLNSTGPWSLDYVNPADDPRRR
jgi:quercetin dioxygenase-like cupin family protein